MTEYEIYRTLFVVAAILCVVFLLLSILLFFVLDIRNAVGHITGSHAKKQIQKIKAESEMGNTERTGSSSGQVQNLAEGRITDKISTERLSGGPQEETTVLSESQGMNETTVLSEAQGMNETTVLNTAPIMNESPAMNETTVLSGNVFSGNTTGGNVFQIECDITFIHTNEIVI